MQVKNIIFDLGGVILNIDYKGPAKKLQKFKINNFENKYSKVKQERIFDELEKGLISPEQFRDGLRDYFQMNLSDAQVDEVWNAVILDFPPQNIELLLELKEKYNTYLLSNTNIIHYEYYSQMLAQNFNGLSWHDLFNKCFFSFEMNARKPEALIFQKVIDGTGINPHDTLFVDDLKENIQTAQKCHIKTFWLNSGMLLYDAFPRFMSNI